MVGKKRIVVESGLTLTVSLTDSDIPHPLKNAIPPLRMQSGGGSARTPQTPQNLSEAIPPSGVASGCVPAGRRSHTFCFGRVQNPPMTQKLIRVGW